MGHCAGNSGDQNDSRNSDHKGQAHDLSVKIKEFLRKWAREYSC